MCSYVKRGTPFLEQMSGGGQERQRRAGTENVAGIVGTAVALEEAQRSREGYAQTCRSLSGRLVEGVLKAVPGAALTGHPEQRLPNNAHFSFAGAESDSMLAGLDKLGIAASAGSACTSATWEPSHVLTAMGMPLSRAAGVLASDLRTGEHGGGDRLRGLGAAGCRRGVASEGAARVEREVALDP